MGGGISRPCQVIDRIYTAANKVAPAKTAAKQMLEYAKENSLPVVSVGCGDLSADRYMGMYPPQDGVTFYGVDPDPAGYHKVPALGPVVAATADELVAAHPELVGNCGVFLCWPYPDGSGPDGNSGWDLDAIALLKPRWLVVVYEPAGASGSKRLIEALGDGSNFTIDGDGDSVAYSLVSAHTAVDRTTPGLSIYPTVAAYTSDPWDAPPVKEWK